jgi:hypothetical protein
MSPVSPSFLALTFNRCCRPVTPVTDCEPGALYFSVSLIFEVNIAPNWRVRFEALHGIPF